EFRRVCAKITPSTPAARLMILYAQNAVRTVHLLRHIVRQRLNRLSGNESGTTCHKPMFAESRCVQRSPENAALLESLRPVGQRRRQALRGALAKDVRYLHLREFRAA